MKAERGTKKVQRSGDGAKARRARPTASGAAGDGNADSAIPPAAMYGPDPGTPAVRLPPGLTIALPEPEPETPPSEPVQTKAAQAKAPSAERAPRGRSHRERKPVAATPSAPEVAEPASLQPPAPAPVPAPATKGPSPSARTAARTTPQAAADLLPRSSSDRAGAAGGPAVWVRALLFAALPILLAVVLGGFLMAIGKTFIAPASRFASSYLDVKVPKTPALAQSTYLYDRNGHFITTLHAGQNRTEVPLSQMPMKLRDAVIAIEDKDFYSEGAVSITGTIRAAVVDLVNHKAVQGGSTITQQYVKLVYTGNERTISRKLTEVVLAEKLSHRYTKDEILEKYLNLVYFGNGAYGVEAAAQTYWHTHAADLHVVQDAVLAAMIQAPATYNPYTHPKLVKERRNLVLEKMAEEGYITPEKAAKYEKLKIHVLPPPRALEGPSAYFVDFVRRGLQRRYGVPTTFSGGLRVTTTLDSNYQRAAEQAIASHLPSPHDPAAALVAIDPSTGAIRAMVGGKAFNQVKFNLASQAHRQAGSAFKPFTFAAAMEKHIDPRALMSGPPELVVPNPECYDQQKNEPWDVNNFADEAAGTMTLLQALAHSVNTIFAQLVVDVGPDAVADVAHRAGIRSPLHAYCSITLGSQPVTPLEMTDAYATFAARGIHHPWQGLQVVKGPDGKVMGRLQTQGVRAIDQNDADLVTYAMQGVITGGTGTAANIGRPAAGKTGTGQNFQDAWFCGFVPQLVACVWVGYPKGEIPMHNVEGYADVFGGSIPAGIWHDFMIKVLANVPVEGFPTPSFSGYDVQPERIVQLPPPPKPQPVSPSPGTNETPSPQPMPQPTKHCNPNRPHCKPG